MNKTNNVMSKKEFNNIPTVFVIFGATGDLISKKIAPALFDLFQNNKLPKLLHIIGYSRRDLDDKGFKEHIRSIINKIYLEEKSKPSQELLEKFISRFSYHKGLFDDKEGYKSLAEELGSIDGVWKVCSNKLFYLAVPPEDYEIIFNNLAESGLTIPCGSDEGWTRVLVEKPFGKDLVTAKKLDDLLIKLFKEEQIYRIDHYLAKEMLQNILSFRFNNSIFESTWNAKNIERIDIKLWEKLGVETRGAFYDGVGALRDVGQNHALQMLALVTMENPGVFDANFIRQARTDILSQVTGPVEDKCKTDTYRAQYEGYTSVEGVASNSKTETYFKAKFNINNERWQGVPIYIEAGKRIGQVLKETIITFKNPESNLSESDNNQFRNRVIFSFEPEECIKIDFISKKPGLDYEIEQKTFNFDYRGGLNRKQYIEEYEKLLLDAFLGDQTLFVSTSEIKEMWSIVDPIILAWEKNIVPLKKYQPDTDQAVVEANREFTNNEKSRLVKSIGIIGMGKMGGNMAKRLAAKGWHVVGYQRDQNELQEFTKFGIAPAKNLADLVSKLDLPRIILLMLPAGEATESVLLGSNGLIKYVDLGDYLIDGSNNYFEDTQKHYKTFESTGINFIDMGISGGPSGARNGACLMVGGDEKNFEYLKPLYKDLSQNGNAFDFFPGAGAGHFVKMVHNGIEYGMMQSIAEGFNFIKKSPYLLDLTKVAQIYQKGSVIESRLIGWLLHAYYKYGQDLGIISGSVAQTGEGMWTVDAAKKMKVDVASIKLAVDFRTNSTNNPSYTGQILSALRQQFGGHSVIKN